MESWMCVCLAFVVVEMGSVGCIVSSSSNVTLAQEVSEKHKTRSSSLISDDVRRHSSSGIGPDGRQRRLEGGATKPRTTIYSPAADNHAYGRTVRMLLRGYTTAKSDPRRESTPRPAIAAAGPRPARARSEASARVRVKPDPKFWQPTVNSTISQPNSQTAADFSTGVRPAAAARTNFVETHVPRPPWEARECPRRSSRLSAR